jgi:hypothetical protein
LKINCWISHRGLSSKNYFGDFPYTGLAPSIRKYITFNSIEDVFDELVRLYDKAHNSNMTEKLGESLYRMAGFFCDYPRLVRTKHQVLIKKYLYCKASNTPPYDSIQDTPADFIEDWLIVDNEVAVINNTENVKHAQKKRK